MKIVYNGKNFKEVLRVLRRALDMNQDQFVAYLNGKSVTISKSSLAKYESGFTNPFSDYGRITEIKNATEDICAAKNIELVIDGFEVTP